jgi:hypothetical protein
MLAVHESVEDVSIDKRNCKQRSVSTEQVNDTYDRRDVLTKRTLTSVAAQYWLGTADTFHPDRVRSIRRVTTS